jgi:small GTP-binding protein
MGSGCSRKEISVVSTNAPGFTTLTTTTAARHPDYEHLFKILLVGDSGAGKSSILIRYTDDVFNSSQMSTIGVDFRIKTVTLKNGTRAKLQIWDTAGQERFRTITSSYYRGCNAALIVYNVANRDTFENVNRWFTEVQRYTKDNTLVYLIANQVDKRTPELVGQVSTTPSCIREAEGKSLAQHITERCTYLETSAKTGQGVSYLFEHLAETLANGMGTSPTERPVRGGAAQQAKTLTIPSVWSK